MAAKRGLSKEKEQAMLRERLLLLEKEVQELRLELETRDNKIEALTQDLRRQANQENERISLSLRSEMESVCAQSAASVAQLVTQEHLLARDESRIAAADVLRVARNLIKALESSGLELLGPVGAIAEFDCNLHDSLNAQEEIAEGESIQIKMVGICYKGHIVRRALVCRTS